MALAGLQFFPDMVGDEGADSCSDENTRPIDNDSGSEKRPPPTVDSANKYQNYERDNPDNDGESNPGIVCDFPTVGALAFRGCGRVSGGRLAAFVMQP